MLALSVHWVLVVHSPLTAPMLALSVHSDLVVVHSPLTAPMLALSVQDLAQSSAFTAPMLAFFSAQQPSFFAPTAPMLPSLLEQHSVLPPTAPAEALFSLLQPTTISRPAAQTTLISFAIFMLKLLGK